MEESKTNDKPLEILVVDDDEGVRSLFEIVLGLAGAKVNTAENGLDGIAKYASGLNSGTFYDAVFTDLSMPKADGAVVTQVVKILNPNTQVIVITGKEPTSEYKALSDKLGQQKPDGILQKPVPPDALSYLLDRIKLVKETRKTTPNYQPEPSFYARLAG